MLVLSCDTSHRLGSLALCEDEQLIAEDHFEPAAEKILVCLEDLLQRQHYDLKDIDLFAVTHGPGSFTGLRIGLSVMKTLAHLYHKPTVGVSTLAALALTYAKSKRCFGVPLMPLLYAGSDEYYGAVYACDEDHMHMILLPQLVTAANLLLQLPKTTQLFGEGLVTLLNSSKVKSALQKRRDLVVDSTANQGPSPHAVALLSLQAFAQGKDLLHASSQPDYLRVSEAERKRGVELDYGA